MVIFCHVETEVEGIFGNMPILREGTDGI